jgi:hypothetical protein
MSTTVSNDSIDISSTIGTARRTTARRIGIAVRSCFDPRNASRSVDHALGLSAASSVTRRRV